MPEIQATTTLATTTQSSKTAPRSDLECFCVRWLRDRLGISIHGNADTLIPNTPLGDITIGTIILFDYGNISHAAVIIGLNRDIATIHEANWRHCKETIREVSIYAPEVRGFYRP